MDHTFVNVVISESAKDLPLPKYATKGSAGMDLLADISEPVVLRPGEYKLIPTGISIGLKEGYEAQIRARSGLALKNGITVFQGIGTLDSDYTGKVGVILVNHSKVDFEVTRGMRIAQIVFAKYSYGQFLEVAELKATDRGTGGYGSTGLTS